MLSGDQQRDFRPVIRKFRTTADDGKSCLTSFYNLDAIAVGYRLDCRQAIPTRLISRAGSSRPQLKLSSHRAAGMRQG
jgi:hypothetical protein